MNVHITIHLQTFYFLILCSWNFIKTNTPSKCSSLASYTALCVLGYGWIFCFLPFIFCCLCANSWERGSNSCFFFLWSQIYSTLCKSQNFMVFWLYLWQGQREIGLHLSADTTRTTKICRSFWLVVTNTCVRLLLQPVYLDSLLVCSLKESSEMEVREGVVIPLLERNRNGRAP